jgi:ornithine carbamoyltransferase
MPVPSQPRHFLTLLDLSPSELSALIQRAITLKQAHYAGTAERSFEGKVLGMVFEKSSTRTRVSFETAMAHFGGSSIFLSPRDTQLGRGEPIEDSARVLSRMVDIVMIRTFEHDKIELFAANSRVPVINALTDQYHPCQLLADVQTYVEHRGSIQGKTAAWIGDGNNMCHSWINAARQFDFQLRIAAPEGYDPDPEILAAAGDRVTLMRDAREATQGADLVTTDVWASMGQEDESHERSAIFAPYQVNAEVMAQAKPDALFLHCLPAHRGEEVTAEVIDGPQSVVTEYRNRTIHHERLSSNRLRSTQRTGMADSA